jgi:hypothetical protein
VTSSSGSKYFSSFSFLYPISKPPSYHIAIPQVRFLGLSLFPAVLKINGIIVRVCLRLPSDTNYHVLCCLFVRTLILVAAWTSCFPLHVSPRYFSFALGHPTLLKFSLLCATQKNYAPITPCCSKCRRLGRRVSRPFLGKSPCCF